MESQEDQRARVSFLLILAAIFSAGLLGCSSTPPPQPEPVVKRYALTGRVVSIDKTKQQVDVDGENIPGFMMAMTMPYAVKDPNLLASLAPEDQITATVVVNGNDVWLENIVVVKKPDQAKTPALSGARPASQPPGKQ